MRRLAILAAMMWAGAAQADTLRLDLGDGIELTDERNGRYKFAADDMQSLQLALGDLPIDWSQWLETDGTYELQLQLLVVDQVTQTAPVAITGQAPVWATGGPQVPEPGSAALFFVGASTLLLGFRRR